MGSTVHPVVESLPPLLLDACRSHYGDRLIALALFGSVGRGTAGPESDVDLFLVASPLPDGRIARAAEFETVERALNPWLDEAHRAGLAPRFSPVFKTPEELAHGTPLLLDMIDDARILTDERGELRRALERLRSRLEKLGARRLWRGNAWVWDLKPDYRPGEIFEL